MSLDCTSRLPNNSPERTPTVRASHWVVRGTGGRWASLPSRRGEDWQNQRGQRVGLPNPSNTGEEVRPSSSKRNRPKPIKIQQGTDVNQVVPAVW